MMYLSNVLTQLSSQIRHKVAENTQNKTRATIRVISIIDDKTTNIPGKTIAKTKFSGNLI